ncbi:Acetyltransferase (isoleucine patch superfamily) [Enterococcus malodoratus]|uniref:acyltransferase n=1 Tax=Enterococcus malodoratus TaxID=71451 RepID=UPI0008D4CB51|nr:acyltransferase [Enterococcus malodoratus]SES96624.1 Acetyltransferase (isoleucine patch superfamily) [Enterococcus malodoratus]
MEKIIQRISGKKEFKLSNEVPISYVLRKAFFYSLGLLRGIVRGVGLKKAGKKLFIGSKVELLNKSKIVTGDYVRIEKNVSIDALSRDGVELGNRVKIGDNSKISCSGSLSNIGKGVKVGNDSSFAENTFFGASGGIIIGNDVISGQNVRFHAENHNFIDREILIRKQGVNRKGIEVSDDVWIGSGVVFLDGAKVGKGSVVAANSVVTKKFPEYAIIGGTPAKIIKLRKEN